jgi:hypothetical protein
MDQQQKSRSASVSKLPQGSDKRVARKKNAKSARGTQPDADVGNLRAETAAPAPSSSTIKPPATDAAQSDFIPYPEPIPHNQGFSCKFTLSRPGLVGLNRLAIFLNDLQDAGSIKGWQARGWEDSANKMRAIIGFADRPDAITAIKSAQ